MFFQNAANLEDFFPVLICYKNFVEPLYLVAHRMTLEQVQDSVHLLQTLTDTFSSLLRSTAETARLHLMSSPR